MSFRANIANSDWYRLPVLIYPALAFQQQLAKAYLLRNFGILEAGFLESQLAD